MKSVHARRKRSQPSSSSGASIFPIGLLGTSPVHKQTHTERAEGSKGSQSMHSALHTALYSPAAKPAVDDAMMASVGSLMGRLDDSIIAMIFLHVLAMPSTRRWSIAEYEHNFDHEKWRATAGAVSLAMSCKMLLGVLLSTGRQEYRELTAMLATTSTPSRQCMQSSRPFLAQIQTEHTSSRAAMVMGEALKSMATHCASSHCQMPRRGSNRLSTQGQIRVAYDTAKRIATAGDEQLIVVTEPTTKKRHGSGLAERTSVLLVSCQTKNANDSKPWHSQSDLKTTQLADFADQSNLPDNVLILQRDNVSVMSLAASHDGMHILIEFAALYALAHVEPGNPEKKEYSYIWLWSADGGGDDHSKPTMYPVSVNSVLNYNAARHSIADDLETNATLKKMWFCTPCETTGRVDFNIVFETPVTQFDECIIAYRYRLHTARSGAVMPGGAWIADKNIVDSLPYHVQLGRPYTTIITHEIPRAKLLSPISTSSDGNLFLAAMGHANDLPVECDHVCVFDTYFEACRTGNSCTLPVESYRPESSTAGFYKPSNKHPLAAADKVRCHHTPMRSAALSPLGDKVAVEVFPDSGDAPACIRLFVSKVDISIIRDSGDDDLNVQDCPNGIWTLAASVQLVVRARTFFMPELHSGPEEDTTRPQEPRKLTVFSPCGRFVMLASGASSSQLGEQVHIVDTDLTRAEQTGVRQYVTSTASCCMPREICWSNCGIWFRTNRGVLLFQPAVVESGL